MIALAAALAANVVAYLLLVRPLAISSAGAGDRAEAAANSVQAAELERAAAQTLVTTRKQVDEDLHTFYQRVLPVSVADARRRTYANLPALAAQANVRYQRRRFEVATLDPATGLGQMTIRMELQGQYDNLRDFIYRVESAPEFVIIDDLTLTEESTDQPLTLALTLSTFYRVADDGL
jgi:hypothetical protein